MLCAVSSRFGWSTSPWSRCQCPAIMPSVVGRFKGRRGKASSRYPSPRLHPGYLMPDDRSFRSYPPSRLAIKSSCSGSSSSGTVCSKPKNLSILERRQSFILLDHAEFALSERHSQYFSRRSSLVCQRFTSFLFHWPVLALVSPGFGGPFALIRFHCFQV